MTALALLLFVLALSAGLRFVAFGLVLLLRLAARVGWSAGLVWAVRQARRVRPSWDGVEAGAMIGAAIFLVGALLGASLTESPHVTEVDSQTGAPVTMGTVNGDLRQASDQTILTAFAPVLSLSAQEGRPPRRVDDYLAESTVVDLTGQTVLTHPTPDQLGGTTCPAGQPLCRVVVDAGCPDTPACTPWETVAAPGHAYDDPDVMAYARVVRRPANGSWDESPFGSSLSFVAQWWFFMPFDSWTTHLGWTDIRLVKQHSGDWEGVTVGFSDTKPLFVAGTSHCGGTWREFADARFEDAGRVQDLLVPGSTRSSGSPTARMRSTSTATRGAARTGSAARAPRRPACSKSGCSRPGCAT